MDSAKQPAATAEELEDLVFKALASRPRRKILRLLATGVSAESGSCCSTDEVCACDVVERLGLGAPTISHHMKALIDAQLVSAEKRGAWVYYRLRPDTAERLTRDLEAVFGCTKGTCR